MAAPTIPLYTGTVPNRNQSANDFSDNADDWLAYQAPLAADYNSLATYLDDLAIEVDNDAAAAEQSATESANSATESANSAVLSQSSANFKGNWSDLTGTLNIPAVVYHNGINWQLLNNLADVTLSEPSVTDDWSIIDNSARITHNSILHFYRNR